MISRNLALAAQRLAQDVVTGEVVEAMRRRGVRPLLIKGPVLERWLYQDGTKRRHGDIDLVVASDQFDDAEAALAELGFAEPLDVSAHIDLLEYEHEHEWLRQGHSIDLHRGVWGLNGDPAAVWGVLTENVDQLVIAGTSVEVPNVAVCAMLVAVHAVQHGDAPKPLEDLRRALGVADESIWRAAARLAERVDALGRFAMGLCLFAAGQELVADLQLPVAGSVDDYLRVAGEAEVAGGFQRLAQVSTRRARLTMLIDELWPSDDYMRLRHPLARRRRGMAVAHLGRLAWLCKEAPRAWLAWRRAVARARRAGSDGQRSSIGTRRRIWLAGEVLLAYGRARRRMASEQDARRLVALTRRGAPAPADGAPAPADGAPAPADDITQGRRLGRAVGRVLWMLPAQRGCLARSLVLVDLLQRRGIAGKLVIGVQVEPAFHAHAWVELHGEPLLSPGGFADSRLAEL